MEVNMFLIWTDHCNRNKKRGADKMFDKNYKTFQIDENKNLTAKKLNKSKL